MVRCFSQRVKLPFQQRSSVGQTGLPHPAVLGAQRTPSLASRAAPGVKPFSAGEPCSFRTWGTKSHRQVLLLQSLPAPCSASRHGFHNPYRSGRRLFLRLETGSGDPIPSRRCPSRPSPNSSDPLVRKRSRTPVQAHVENGRQRPFRTWTGQIYTRIPRGDFADAKFFLLSPQVPRASSILPPQILQTRTAKPADLGDLCGR